MNLGGFSPCWLFQFIEHLYPSSVVTVCAFDYLNCDFSVPDWTTWSFVPGDAEARSLLLGFGGEKKGKRFKFVAGVIPDMLTAVLWKLPEEWIWGIFLPTDYFSLLCISTPARWSLSVHLLIKTAIFFRPRLDNLILVLCAGWCWGPCCWDLGSWELRTGFQLLLQSVGRRKGAALGRAFSFQCCRGSPSGEIPLPTDSRSPRTNLVYRRRNPRM